MSTDGSLKSAYENRLLIGLKQDCKANIVGQNWFNLINLSGNIINEQQHFFTSLIFISIIYYFGDVNFDDKN